MKTVHYYAGDSQLYDEPQPNEAVLCTHQVTQAMVMEVIDLCDVSLDGGPFDLIIPSEIAYGEIAGWRFPKRLIKLIVAPDKSASPDPEVAFNPWDEATLVLSSVIAKIHGRRCRRME